MLQRRSWVLGGVILAVVVVAWLLLRPGADLPEVSEAGAAVPAQAEPHGRSRLPPRTESVDHSQEASERFELARTGLPRGQQAVASVGWAVQPAVFESLDPVKPVVDAELYGGIELPDANSMALEAASGRTLFPVAGLKMSAGLMF